MGRKLFFRSADGNWITGPSNACTAPLCCSANRAVRYWAQKSTGRFHIDNMFVRGHKDSNCPGTCCDNDCNDQGGCNCGRGIHISGVRQMGGTHMDLGYICNTEEDGYPFNTQADEDFADLIITPGTLFRWKEDPYQIVYRVTSCGDSRDLNTDQGSPSFNWKKGILNYSSESSERKAKKNKSVRLYLKFLTTGWRLDNDQANSGTYAFFEDEEGLSPFNFKLSGKPIP